jgi:DNA-binding protein
MEDTTQEPTQTPTMQQPVQREQKLVQREQKPDNTIYVGKKNVMAYVLAVVTQFNQGSPFVKVKARGQSISRAVDVSQIVKNRFMASMQITGFEVATEELPNEDGTTSRVSSVTLTLSK